MHFSKLLFAVLAFFTTMVTASPTPSNPITDFKPVAGFGNPVDWPGPVGYVCCKSIDRDGCHGCDFKKACPKDDVSRCPSGGFCCGFPPGVYPPETSSPTPTATSTTSTTSTSSKKAPPTTTSTTSSSSKKVPPTTTSTTSSSSKKVPPTTTSSTTSTSSKKASPTTSSFATTPNIKYRSAEEASAAGVAAGAYGWPTSEQYCCSNWCRQCADSPGCVNNCPGSQCCTLWTWS